MRRFLKDNGLTIVLLLMFAGSLVGMFVSGHSTYDEELRAHGQAPIDAIAYLSSGEFLSAVFENWESEFLQMSAYVVLTAMLFQRGSAESRDPDDPHRPRDNADGGGHPIAMWLYRYSLGLTLAILFVASFVLHWWGSHSAANVDAAMHGLPPSSLFEHLGSAQLWFESFQNWQSEFLSTALLVVLSIFLRHKGSPESKPVAARNEKTGAE